MANYRFDPADFHADASADRAVGGNETVTFEQFMIEEGLDLLASFRSIPDRSIRDAIGVMIRGLASNFAEKAGD